MFFGMVLIETMVFPETVGFNQANGRCFPDRGACLLTLALISARLSQRGVGKDGGKSKAFLCQTRIQTVHLVQRRVRHVMDMIVYVCIHVHIYIYIYIRVYIIYMYRPETFQHCQRWLVMRFGHFGQAVRAALSEP